MIVGILGGTGRMGTGLARQLSKRNTVVIGSRDAARAREAAKSVPGARGVDYAAASRQAEVVVIAVPYAALGVVSTLRAELEGKLVLSAVNPLKMQQGLFLPAPKGSSAAEELAELIPGSRVATAFNNIPSAMLDGQEVPPIDVLVASESRETFAQAAAVVSSVDNLRPIYVGPLSQASVVEGLTALVLNISKLNRTGSVATKFVSRRGR